MADPQSPLATGASSTVRTAVPPIASTTSRDATIRTPAQPELDVGDLDVGDEHGQSGKAPAAASPRRSEVAEGDRGRAVSVGKLKGPHANEVERSEPRWNRTINPQIKSRFEAIFTTCGFVQQFARSRCAAVA